jgi:hypothetical protein
VESFRRRYGAGPLHLVVAIVSFALAGYALSRVFGEVSSPLRFFIWFGGAIVAHDLLLFPLYALLGLLVVRATRATDPSDRLRVAALNHLRVPLLLSGLSLLVWFPLVLGRAEPTYMAASGLSNDVYLGRWLLLSGALFLGSAIVFALRFRGLRATARR